MKRFLFLLLPLVFSLASAQTNVLTGNIETFGQAGRTNVTMLMALLSPKNQTAVTNFVSNDNLSAVSDSNGNFYFSNILAGTYFLTAQDSSLTRFKIPVYTNTLGTVTLASLANAGGIPPNPSTNFVTQAQLTASLAGISGGGGSATNVNFIASATIVPTIVGGSNQFNLTSGTLPNNISGSAATATTAVNLSGSITASQVTGQFSSNSVTSINGSQVQGAVAGALNATNLSGTVTAAQITGTIALSQLPTSIVTNLSTGSTSLGQFGISNSTYGGLSFQRSPVGNEISIDTFGGNLRITPATGSSLLGFFPGGFGITQQYPFYCYKANQDFNHNIFDFNNNKLLWRFLSWADPQNIQGSGFSVVPVSVYGYIGGDASGAEGLPVTSDRAMIDAMPVVPMQLTTYCQNSDTSNTNENQCTNLLASVSASGLLAAITNAGGTLVFHHDQNARLINLNRDGNGNLTLDTTNFPDGTNYAGVVHSFGAQLEGTIYDYQYPTNEADFAPPGGGFPAFAMITPNSRNQDFSSFYDFNFDGIRISDRGFTASGNQLAWTRKVSENILNPSITTNSSFITTLMPYGLPTAQGGKGKFKPMFYEQLTPEIDDAPAEAISQVNWFGPDQITWNGLNTNSSTSQSVFAGSMFRGIMTFFANHVGPGHYAPSYDQFFTTDYSIPITRQYLALESVGLCVIHFSANSTNTFASERPNFLATADNAPFLSAYFDKLASQPKILYDNGTNNMVAYRQTTTGYELALDNESLVPTNLTINLAAIGADPTKQWTVTDCWGTNNTGASVTTTYGPYSGSFVFSNTPPTSAAFLVLTPAGVTGIGSGLTSLNASQLTSGTVPTAQLSGNNITNSTGFFFPPGGGSSFVNGSANGTSQTNMNHYAGTYNGSGGSNTFTPTTNQFIFAGPVGTAAISNGVYYGLATALTNASGHTLLGTTDSGSGLTSLNASQLSSGVVPLAALGNAVTNLQPVASLGTVQGIGGALQIGGPSDVISIGAGNNGQIINIGSESSALDAGSVVFGVGATTTGNTGVAVGFNATSAFDAISIGDTSSASVQDAIAIGADTSVSTSGNASIAIGTLITLTQPYFIQLGRNNLTPGYQTWIPGTLEVGAANGRATNPVVNISPVVGSATNSFQVNGTNGTPVLTLSSNNVLTANGGGVTNQGYARSLTGTNILWTPTVQSDGNTNWSGVITSTPAITITGQLPALNASALTSLNAANVSGVWAAPVVTNFAGSVTFSNLNVPNTTATLALLPSQVPNATQVTNMIAANASGGGSILATLVTNNASTPIVVTGSGASSTISTNQIAVTGAGVSTTINSNIVTTGSILATNLATFILTQTNFVSGVSYLNTNPFPVTVSVLSSVTAGTSVGNVAGYQLWYDNFGGTAWKTNDDGTTISAIGTLAMTTHYKLNGKMGAGYSFVFTNISVGGSSSLVPNTGQISSP